MYELYVQDKKGNWKSLTKHKDSEKIFKKANKLTYNQYIAYLIINHTEQGDIIITTQDLSEECQIEYVDNLKTDYKVVATTFTLEDRIKEKEDDEFLK